MLSRRWIRHFPPASILICPELKAVDERRVKKMKWHCSAKLSSRTFYVRRCLWPPLNATRARIGRRRPFLNNGAITRGSSFTRGLESGRAG